MGVYSAAMGIYNVFRLLDHCSMHQAEVTSIEEAMIEIIKPNTRDINLFSDSQAALRTLDSSVKISKTVME